MPGDVTVLLQLSDCAIEDLADHLFALAGAWCHAMRYLNSSCLCRGGMYSSCLDVLCSSVLNRFRLHIRPQQPRFYQEPLLYHHGYGPAHQVTTPFPLPLPPSL
jgi:hypothetical protein